jgi:hypothetical protein
VGRSLTVIAAVLALALIAASCSTRWKYVAVAALQDGRTVIVSYIPHSDESQARVHLVTGSKKLLLAESSDRYGPSQGIFEVAHNVGTGELTLISCLPGMIGTFRGDTGEPVEFNAEDALWALGKRYGSEGGFAVESKMSREEIRKRFCSGSFSGRFYRRTSLTIENVHYFRAVEVGREDDD